MQTYTLRNLSRTVLMLSMKAHWCRGNREVYLCHLWFLAISLLDCVYQVCRKRKYRVLDKCDHAGFYQTICAKDLSSKLCIQFSYSRTNYALRIKYRPNGNSNISFSIFVHVVGWKQIQFFFLQLFFFQNTATDIHLCFFAEAKDISFLT